MNFSQVLSNHFYFVVNKNGSQLNALLNLNDSCLCSFIDFIHIWSQHLMGVWSQLFSDCFNKLLLDLNRIQFNLSNLQNRDLQKQWSTFKDKVPYFSQFTKATFQSPNANMATFIIFRHPLTLCFSTDKWHAFGPRFESHSGL